MEERVPIAGCLVAGFALLAGAFLKLKVLGVGV